MLIVLGLAAAPAHPRYAAEQGVPCGHQYTTHLHGYQEFKKLAVKAWSPNRWRDKHPVKDWERERIRHYKGCARTAFKRERMVRIAKRADKKFRAARRANRLAASLTPYDCGSAGSFAIPCYIVACESHFDWFAANPSGAVGVYQLLGWGAPHPADTQAERLVHHRIAARLWAGGAGASHWVCA